MSGELTGPLNHPAAEPGKNRYANCNVAGSFISTAGIYLIALLRINEFVPMRLDRDGLQDPTQRNPA
jgi:hypothetical protein